MVQADPAKRHRHLPLGIGAGSSETHSWLVFLCAFPFGNLSLDLMVPSSCLSLLAWLFFYGESPLKYWLANRSHIQPIYLHFHHPFRVPWI